MNPFSNYMLLMFLIFETRRSIENITDHQIIIFQSSNRIHSNSDKGAFNDHVDKKAWVGGPKLTIFVQV